MCLPTKEHLEDILGLQVLATNPLVVDNGGAHSRIFRVRTSRADYVLRMPKGRQGWHTAYLPETVDVGNWFDQRWATSVAHGLSIPAPEIVHSDRERGFVLMKQLPGEYIADYEQWAGCPYDEAEFGVILSRLHSVSVGGYGPVDDAGATYFEGWPDFLAAAAAQLMDACSRRGSIGDDLHALLRRRWYPRLRELALGRAALLHMESLGFANILYDAASRAITGFIDYEDCIGGDPLYEFTWMAYYLGDRDGAGPYFDYAQFEKGYGPLPRDDRAVRLYRAFPYLEKLSWINAGTARADHHREALGQLCRALGADGAGI